MISVIVPVYNVEKYLKQCIDSLLVQTYRDFEIILVDDGSTDSSGLICDEYSKMNSNIKVIHKSNEGLGFARNTGLVYVSGDYVTFVDSDDYVAPTLLENLFKGINEKDVNVCIGGYKKINDSGDILYEEKYDTEIYERTTYTNEVFIKMLGSLPNKHDSVRMSVWNALYDMSIINNNNIRFPSERELISEDLIFDFYYFQHVNKCKLLNNSDYYYRTNPNSLTMTYRKDRFKKTMVFYQHLNTLMINNSFSNESLIRFKKLIFIYVRMCIRQEKKKISNLKIKDSLINIKKICEEKSLKKIINEYPVEQLEFKQKIFIYCIKHKITILLYLFA